MPIDFWRTMARLGLLTVIFLAGALYIRHTSKQYDRRELPQEELARRMLRTLVLVAGCALLVVVLLR
jgi:hypothetical protein